MSAARPTDGLDEGVDAARLTELLKGYVMQTHIGSTSPASFGEVLAARWTDTNGPRRIAVVYTEVTCAQLPGADDIIREVVVAVEEDYLSVSQLQPSA